MKKRFVVLGLLLLCLGGKAQDAYVPSPENLEARKEFQDSKFGIFLHWGLYSMLAQGEWVMTNQNLDTWNTASWLLLFILPVSMRLNGWLQ